MCTARPQLARQDWQDVRRCTELSAFDDLQKVASRESAGARPAPYFVRSRVVGHTSRVLCARTPAPPLLSHSPVLVRRTETEAATAAALLTTLTDIEEVLTNTI